MKRMVFTQAGAGLVDSELGDIYGNRMERVLDGKSRPSMLIIMANIYLMQYIRARESG